MSLTLLGIVTLARLMQSKNASSPMLVRLLGIVTPVRLGQAKNALEPMLVTLLGIVTLVRLQKENASSPMLVTLVPIMMLVTLVEKWNAKSSMRVIGRPFVRLGMVTAPPGPVYPVIVIMPLLVMKVNWAFTTAGRATSSGRIHKTKLHRRRNWWTKCA